MVIGLQKSHRKRQKAKKQHDYEAKQALREACTHHNVPYDT
jgi:hypothetical protein